MSNWASSLNEEKIKRIKENVLATSQISPSVRVFLSVIATIDLEEEIYFLGCMDLSSNRIFDLKYYFEPDEAATRFADLVLMFRGFKDEIRA